jgi:hypothetical protein
MVPLLNKSVANKENSTDTVSVTFLMEKKTIRICSHTYHVLLKIIFLLIITLPSYYGFSQSLPLPQLTQEQMYADYDTLISTLKQVSPQYAFRKKLTGIDINNIYANDREKIKTIKSAVDFYRLVAGVLMVSQDDHTGLLWPGFPQNEMLKQGLSNKEINLVKVYDSLFKAPLKQNRLNLPLRYLNGKYYTIGEFRYDNQQYNKGLQLLSCDGINVNTYVNHLLRYVPMHWDNEYKVYFSNAFLRATNFSPTDSIRMVFKDQQHRLIKAKFCLGDSLQQQNSSKKEDEKKVLFFTKDHILYIRLPAMELADTSFYDHEIANIGQHQTIYKTVIDIRNNGGGTDKLWKNILSRIISRPIIYHQCLIMNRIGRHRIWQDHA